MCCYWHATAVLIQILSSAAAMRSVEMDDEKLIEYVRNHEELYNIWDGQYVNTNVKTKVWTEIANKLGHPADVCKSRWGNIRDNFRKSLKKRVLGNGRVAKKYKKYKYEKNLSFLMPFIRETEPHSLVNIEKITGNESDTSAVAAYIKEETLDQDRIAISSVQSLSNIEEHSIKSTNGNATTDDIVSAPSPQSEPRNRVVCSVTNLKTRQRASATLMKYMTERKKQAERSSLQPHPVDAFLAGLAPTLKSLAPYNLNIAKSKIFNIVQEIEMTEIMQAQGGSEHLSEIIS